MRVIDISGHIEQGMWYADVLYPPVKVEDIDPLDWPSGEGKVYGQRISFGSQTSTCIATGAHLYPNRPDIASISLDRLIVRAVIAQVDVVPSGRLTLEEVQRSLKLSGVAPKSGDALLIAAGWDQYWNTERYLAESPRLARELVEWAVEQRVGILGSDIPMWDASWEENFWPAFYASDTLPLAPLVGLRSVEAASARLVALPLKIKGSCGSPCRAILEVDD